MTCIVASRFCLTFLNASTSASARAWLQAAALHARMAVTLLVAAFVLSACGSVHPAFPDHASIAPLQWSACGRIAPAPFECATAVVPLDYAHPGDGRTVRLQVIRHPAAQPADRLGAIFFNPGGPGGAGTTDMPHWIGHFPPALLARFDLISWDPRGVGYSTAVRCFDSKADEDAFKSRMPSGFPVGDAQVALQANLQAEFNRQCAMHAGDLLAHVSTADTARDLEWLRRAAGESQMNFLGVSYGTLVGATYLNLFPGAVRTAVLDGNMDPVAYFARASSQGTSVRIANDIGTSQTLAAFFAQCAAAGAPRCAFAGRGMDAAALEAKFALLTARVDAHPVRVPDFPGAIFNAPFLLMVTADSLFTVDAFDTFPGWSALASLLQQVWNASGSVIVDSREAAPALVTRASASVSVAASSGAGAKENAAADEPYDSDGAEAAVQCGESPNPRPMTRYPQIAALAAQRAGDIAKPIAWFDAPCSEWPGKAAAPYAGPWHAHTAPVLVIGNRYDPSTAYASSQKMATLLGDARLLTVDGYGHTALLNPSRCVNDAETAYFVDGVLPPAGTVCRQDDAPFTTPAGRARTPSRHKRPAHSS